MEPRLLSRAIEDASKFLQNGSNPILVWAATLAAIAVVGELYVKFSDKKHTATEIYDSFVRIGVSPLHATAISSALAW